MSYECQLTCCCFLLPQLVLEVWLLVNKILINKLSACLSAFYDFIWNLVATIIKQTIDFVSYRCYIEPMINGVTLDNLISYS
jgi:hypothetical protein